jgi:hypothetical protein
MGKPPGSHDEGADIVLPPIRSQVTVGNDLM